LNDYERTFVFKMNRVQRAGINFEDLAREALVGKFGGATEVMLRDLSANALADPGLFVMELNGIFGRGAIAVFEPIVRYVDLGLYSQGGNSPILALLSQLGPALADGVTTGVLLHDQRVKDEDGNYADNAN